MSVTMHEGPPEDETPFTDYWCYFCPTCGTEAAGWGGVPEDFDPENFCECPKEES